MKLRPFPVLGYFALLRAFHEMDFYEVANDRVVALLRAAFAADTGLESSRAPLLCDDCIDDDSNCGYCMHVGHCSEDCDDPVWDDDCNDCLEDGECGTCLG